LSDTKFNTAAGHWLVQDPSLPTCNRKRLNALVKTGREWRSH